MKYRVLGKTGLAASELSLGGHWRNREGGRFWGSFSDDRVPEDVRANRNDVISHAIELGINYVHITTPAEALAYGSALKGRREKMYVGYSDYLLCIRNPKNRNKEAIMREIDEGLRRLGSDYMDIFRPQARMDGKHTDEEIRTVVEVAQLAMKQGKFRHLGISSHNRPFLRHLLKTFSEFEMIILPFAGFSKVKEENSVFPAARKRNVGVVAIKPFPGGSLFKKNKVDDGKDIARLSLRRILSNRCLTCTISGMTSIEEMDNNFRAQAERRKLSKEENRILDNAITNHFTSLPRSYQWLRDWTYV